MINLVKILKAEAMGWSATIENKNHGRLQVIRMTHNFIQAIEEDTNKALELANYLMEQSEITGYLYGAELCGNEPIPEGQKFKIKGSGEIREHITDSVSAVCLRGRNVAGNPTEAHFPKPEIEPYFD